MKVFLSWSGTRSRRTAEVLSEWLPQMIQAVEPWMSSETEKGTRWGSEIANKLEESKVGIICLTRENLNENWILFEAGALSKTKDAHVCTFLLDLKPTDIKQPLAQFQATQFRKEDVLKLITTINRVVEKVGEHSLNEKVLSNLFSVLWPQLEEKLSRISEEKEKSDRQVRSDREILEEILGTIRALEKLFESERFRDPEKAIRKFEEIVDSFSLEQEKEDNSTRDKYTGGLM